MAGLKMIAPEEQTKSLINFCPKCGKNLYAYWATPAGDHPELGCWYVECTNWHCKYEDQDNYSDLNDLEKKYKIDPA